MSKHTPGPWGFEKTMLHSDHEAENIFANDGSEYLAAVWKGENSVANARLIASAPDMLEALKTALGAASRNYAWDAKYTDLTARFHFHDEMEDLKEAIAKAEG